jgi:mono/diheme cytochrome c family protein
MLFALSTESEIALAVMGAIFIVFSLVSSFVLPRKNPDFPGRKWRNAYVVLCIGLFLAMMSTVVVFGKDVEEVHAEDVAAENPGETSSTETTPTETTPTETKRAPGPYDNGDATAGKVVFVSSCGVCHVLKAADATGAVGPNLDEKKPDETLTIDRVVNGKGTMPAFKGQLTDQQIADVVAFVHVSTQS